jgi:hypothetical protein
MKNQILIILFLLTFTSLATYGQDNPPIRNQFQHFIGVGAGFTTGFGVSYRYIPDNFGMQLNFAPYYDKNNNSFVSAGLTLLQKLKETPDRKLYLYFGNSLLYQKTYNEYYNVNYPNSTKTVVTTSNIVNTGLGLDFQFYTPNSPFVFDVMGGLGAYDSFSRVTFTGEFAIYYAL